MAQGLKVRRCAYHPDRPGLATCMQCRKVICQECATQWDGINYCTQCLAGMRRTARARAPVGAWAIVALALPALFYATARAMVWALVTMWEIVG